MRYHQVYYERKELYVLSHGESRRVEGIGWQCLRGPRFLYVPRQIHGNTNTSPCSSQAACIRSKKTMRSFPLCCPSLSNPKHLYCCPCKKFTRNVKIPSTLRARLELNGFTARFIWHVSSSKPTTLHRSCAVKSRGSFHDDCTEWIKHASVCDSWE